MHPVWLLAGASVNHIFFCLQAISRHHPILTELTFDEGVVGYLKRLPEADSLAVFDELIHADLANVSADSSSADLMPQMVLTCLLSPTTGAQHISLRYGDDQEKEGRVCRRRRRWGRQRQRRGWGRGWGRQAMIPSAISEILQY